MCDVKAFDGTSLIFRRMLPRNRLSPVKVRLHGVTVLVLLTLVSLIAAECRVGKSLADDGVAHPVHKLSVFGIRYFVLVHPEAIDRYFLLRNPQSPKRVGSHALL